MSRSTIETSPVSKLLESYPSRLRKHWRGGLSTTLVVTVLLALRWLNLESNVYESSALIEARARAPSANTTGVAGTPLEALVRSAVPELQASALHGNQLAGPGSALIKQIHDTRLLLICRGDEPSSAQQLCAELVSRAMAALAAARLVTSPSVPTAALAVPDDVTRTIWLTSLFTGIVAGLAWAIMGARRAAIASALEPHSTRAVSSIPPAMADADPSARRGSMRAREASGSHATSGPESSRPARDVRVTAYEVDPDWEFVPSLSTRTAAKIEALCSQLFVAAANESLLIGVSSALDARDLKSRAAAQVAWHLSLAGQVRILLIEADFDFPAVGRGLGLEVPARAGFSQQLLQRAQTDSNDPWVVLQCSQTLSVLLEGRVRTPGMLTSPALRSAFEALRRHFDIIIVDGPPVGQGGDGRAFSRLIDGVVFVSTSGSAEAQAQAQQFFPTQRIVLPLSSALLHSERPIAG